MCLGFECRDTRKREYSWCGPAQTHQVALSRAEQHTGGLVMARCSCHTWSLREVLDNGGQKDHNVWLQGVTKGHQTPSVQCSRETTRAHKGPRRRAL